ncbi:hypothetical protein EIN_227460 [Entamoeba invadens IP1]|uniref:VPS9 domain-containing protein n=1 Tax=Entamoeba invadens IP1 TaxID=370355 RepID=A0A0A1U8M3_ENTIV|nr:hypothetical protein EIN_227460 [Entamoeba invadens IP1]ELP88333.1 hypothetical protein EIN_227460 [Entamoeba invadens IP1]|eukprot:XP_004255104.1 hypothetical protein EIN_227460 [Entamoeba invadens IP1]
MASVRTYGCCLPQVDQPISTGLKRQTSVQVKNFVSDELDFQPLISTFVSMRGKTFQANTKIKNSESVTSSQFIIDMLSSDLGKYAVLCAIEFSMTLCIPIGNYSLPTPEFFVTHLIRRHPHSKGFISLNGIQGVIETDFIYYKNCEKEPWKCKYEEMMYYFDSKPNNTEKYNNQANITGYDVLCTPIGIIPILYIKEPLKWEGCSWGFLCDNIQNWRSKSVEKKDKVAEEVNCIFDKNTTDSFQQRESSSTSDIKISSLSKESPNEQERNTPEIKSVRDNSHSCELLDDEDEKDFHGYSEESENFTDKSVTPDFYMSEGNDPDQKRILKEKLDNKMVQTKRSQTTTLQPKTPSPRRSEEQSVIGLIRPIAIKRKLEKRRDVMPENLENEFDVFKLFIDFRCNSHFPQFISASIKKFPGMVVGKDLKERAETMYELMQTIIDMTGKSPVFLCSKYKKMFVRYLWEIFTTELFEYIWPPLIERNEQNIVFVCNQQDVILSNIISIHQFIAPHHFDLAFFETEKGKESVDLIGSHLRQINMVKSPRNKAFQVYNTFLLTIDIISKLQPTTVSADLLLPTIIFAIIHSAPLHLVSTIEYLKAFIPRWANISSEVTYYITNLHSAVLFLLDLKQVNLTLSPTDYSLFLYYAKRRINPFIKPKSIFLKDNITWNLEGEKHESEVLTILFKSEVSELDDEDLPVLLSCLKQLNSENNNL